MIPKGVNISGEDDCELVLLAQHGVTAAFDKLILRHQETIARQMRRFSHDTRVVEELTQTVFVKAYMGLRGYNPDSPFIHWLRAIAARTGYDHWREQYKRKSFLPFDEAVHGGITNAADGPNGEVNKSEAARKVLEHILARLKPDERQTLYMIYIDGMSLREVAETMGWNTAMTKMRSYRARKKLREIIDKDKLDLEQFDF